MEIVSFDRAFEPELSAHLARHWAESGREGPHFLPFDLAQADMPNGIDTEACFKSFDEYGWQRWLLVLVENHIRGHCSLKSDGLRTGRHRCELGIGLEAEFRNMGIGRELLERAVRTAKSAQNIEWMDLHVLSENQQAIALYQDFGFRTIGTIEDRCRIQGESLDEIIMTLRLEE